MLQPKKFQNYYMLAPYLPLLLLLDWDLCRLDLDLDRHDLDLDLDRLDLDRRDLDGLDLDRWDLGGLDDVGYSMLPFSWKYSWSIWYI